MKARFGIVFILCLFAVSPARAAACASPNGNTGDIIFSSSNGNMYFCNGSSWIGMGLSAGFGTLTSGDFCAASSGVQISCTTSAINMTSQVTGVLPAANGGTGVNNGINTITLGSSFVTSGAHTLTLTTTAATNVTLPTSGTLTSGSGTTNYVTLWNGANSLTSSVIVQSGSNIGVGVAAAPVGQLSLGNPYADTNLRTYAATDQGFFNFYQAQNFPGTNTYNRSLDIVSASGSGTAQSIIRFLNQQSISGGPVEAMRINQSGYVSIGTTLPSEQLDVYKVAGAAPAIGSSNAGILRVEEGTGANGIDIGEYYVPGQTPYGWIQSQFSGNAAAYYALSLNPLGGNVGIGTTAPSAVLQVSSPNAQCYSGFRTTYTGNGGASFDMIQGGDNNLYFCYNAGGVAQINTSGAYTQLSDMRLKTNIDSLTDDSGLTAIVKLRPVSFNFKRAPKDPKNLGFLAQDVEKIFPTLVSTMAIPGGMGDPKDKITDTKSLNYSGLIAPLVKAVQQLKALFDTDHGEIARLQADNARLAARIDALEKTGRK